ncbi:MAG: DUF2073 domain-containing protein [Candidatus Methanoperedens sp.]|nr:DUF2073 domain-containing protein [Candidatus Methanoperedens sp.]MCE8425949.1 DUF2073 domain-containing protein [Candidatus Methanoperedens sp.]MCE8427378.1 DUF2073 domain-containing protein [Candidatus Methanoperedens sp.]
MKGIQLDLISEDKLDGMTSMEKVRLILDEVRNGKILVLEKGLTPNEQTKLIELTMTEIAPDDFAGIEIESYPVKQNDSFFSKLLGKNTMKTRLTVIGPAAQLKTIKKDRDLISALVSP